MNDKNSIFKIIKGQYISEKTNRLSEKLNVITFEVKKDANKYNIKKSIEKIFNVKIESINTMTIKGKKIKFKNFPGKRKDYKKAIIKLKKGYDINFTEFE